MNTGDSSGTGYGQLVDRLADLDTVLPTLPPDLQPRLANTYGTIQLADSIARIGIDQVGRARDNGTTVLTGITNMENDATALSDDLHTQVAGSEQD